MAWWHVLDSKFLKTRGEIFLSSTSLLSVALHSQFSINVCDTFTFRALITLHIFEKLMASNFQNFTIKNIILFIYFGCAGSPLLCRLFSRCGEWGLLSTWGVQASHCGGFSSCGALALWDVGLSVCGMWAL